MTKPQPPIDPREIGLVPEDPANFAHYYEQAREICRRAKDRKQLSDDERIVLAVVASQLALARYVGSNTQPPDATLDAILDILDRGDVLQAMSAKMAQLLSGRASMAAGIALTTHSVTEIPASKTDITTDEEAEIQYWMQLFGVGRHQLINAIQLVGTSVEDVRKFLQTGNEPQPR